MSAILNIALLNNFFFLNLLFPYSLESKTWPGTLQAGFYGKGDRRSPNYKNCPDPKIPAILNFSLLGKLPVPACRFSDSPSIKLSAQRFKSWFYAKGDGQDTNNSNFMRKNGRHLEYLTSEQKFELVTGRFVFSGVEIGGIGMFPKSIQKCLLHR